MDALAIGLMWLVSVVLGIFFFVAQMQLFSITRELKKISRNLETLILAAKQMLPVAPGNAPAAKDVVAETDAPGPSGEISDSPSWLPWAIGGGILALIILTVILNL